MARVKKLWNPGGSQEMDVMVSLWQKILIPVNFVLTPIARDKDTNWPELFLVKKFCHRPTILGFHNFFTLAILCIGLPDLAALFLQLEWLFLRLMFIPLCSGSQQCSNSSFVSLQHITYLTGMSPLRQWRPITVLTRTVDLQVSSTPGWSSLSWLLLCL